MYGSLEGAKTKEGATGLQKLRRSNFSYCKQVQEKMEWAGWVVVVLYLILDYLKGGR